MPRADTLIATLAFCVAVMSVYYTVEQNKASQVHNQLSVTPHLTFRWMIDYRKHSYQLAVRNVGIGPAKIRSFQMLVDDNLIDNDVRGGWAEVMEALDRLEGLTERDIDWLDTGDGIGVGDLRILYRFRLLEDAANIPFEALRTAPPDGQRPSDEEIEKLLERTKRALFDDAGSQIARLKIRIDYESFYGESQPIAEFQYSP